jgi:catechol-2,3-dioxygenase
MLGAPWHDRVAQRPSSLVLVLRRFKRARKLAANEREVYHTSALVKIQKTLKSFVALAADGARVLSRISRVVS